MTNTPIAAKLAAALRDLLESFSDYVGPNITQGKEAIAEYDTAKDSAAGEHWHFESMDAPNGDTVAISIMAADKVIASAYMDGRERDYKFANDICHAHNTSLPQPPHAAPEEG